MSEQAPLNLGSYNPLNLLAVSSFGTLQMSCSGETLVNYQISLSAGGSGSFPQRKLFNGSNTLNYNLYTDLTLLTIWGNGTSGTSVVSGSQVCVLTLPCTVSKNVYGSIPAGQSTVAPGSYADSVLVTVTY